MSGFAMEFGHFGALVGGKPAPLLKWEPGAGGAAAPRSLPVTWVKKLPPQLDEVYQYN